MTSDYNINEALENRTANRTTRRTAPPSNSNFYGKTRLELRNNVYQYRYLNTRISLKTNDIKEAQDLEQRFRDMQELMDETNPVEVANLKQQFIEALVMHRKYLSAMRIHQNQIEYIAHIEANTFRKDITPQYKANVNWLVQELRADVLPSPTEVAAKAEQDALVLQPAQAIQPAQTVEAHKVPEKITISTDDLTAKFALFEKHYKATGASKSTLQSYGSKFRVFNRYCTSHNITEIDRTVAIAYRDHLTNEYSVRTTNNSLTVFGTLFKWLSANDHIHKELKDIWSDLKVRQRGIQAKEEDKACSESDAKAIEATANHIDVNKFKNQNSTLTHNVAKKWIALIMLYSGMRAGEASQLHKEDLLKVDDVWCFSVNNNRGKTVKNSTSIRFIPVHKKLIELGILDLLDNDTEWLYGDTSITSNNFSYHWNTEYQKGAGIKANRHSLRHRFSTLLHQTKDVLPEVVSQLLGHAQQSISLRVYSKGFNVRDLKTTIDKLI
jgi:integrase